jgi:hypothetical protein
MTRDARFAVRTAARWVAAALIVAAGPTLATAQPAAPCNPRSLSLRESAGNARDYVVAGIDARLADEEWRRTLDGGGAVVWTSTLYDVDARSTFLLAFDRVGIRIYRAGQFQDVPAGCIDPLVRPEAVVPWDSVREIKAGNWVLWFKLDRRIAVSSDRGKRKTIDEIKVNLHGASGDLEIRYNWDPYRGYTNVRGIATGPSAFQQRVRFMLVRHFDPAGRIALPKQSRGAGW